MLKSNLIFDNFSAIIDHSNLVFYLVERFIHSVASLALKKVGPYLSHEFPVALLFSHGVCS